MTSKKIEMKTSKNAKRRHFCNFNKDGKCKKCEYNKNRRKV